MKYVGKHRPENVKVLPYEKELRFHINAIDDKGNRYTSHCFADEGDWWWGATILTQGTVDSLRKKGKLPLQEVWVCPK